MKLIYALIYALPFILFASDAMAQAPQTPQDPLQSCQTDAAILRGYLSTNEQAIRDLRGALIKVNADLADLQKKIKEHEDKKPEEPR